MRKIFLTTILLFFVQLSFGQHGKNLIHWDENRPLVWEDFKGRANGASPYQAYTYGGIGFKSEMSSNKEFKLMLEVTFNIEKSWLKKNKGTSILLEHEQRHFDIIELYARIFVKRLEGLEKQSEAKIGAAILRIHRKITKELSSFQIKYDKETNHSILIEKQKEWTIKITELLEDHKDYAKRELVLSIK